MNLKGLIDCHTHTQFSVDSEADINQMIEKAISLRLSAYAVTDHCECNRWYSEDHYIGEDTYRYFDFGKDFENSVSAVCELKEKYSDRINLICGVEMGQALQDVEIAERIVSDKRLDFVIASMHQLPKTEDFAFLDYTKFTQSEIKNLLERYFTEIHKMCLWGKFDILGHLTYVLRYIEGAYGVKVDMTPYDDIIEEIFKAVVSKGNGIEINTSGLRQKYGDTFPTYKYVKRYKELGGEILSLGSDTHFVEDVGKGIFEGSQIAKKAGFDYIAYYKNRKPEFIKI
ncbi:MAG: histidinol-phosphatase HisJ family protein [Oscillospiraceae bacterium]|nr:histidinol-phosphatase HisJ family protein [Oscillospiraceae bacterium]MBQ8883270.1 histidinol-phosphatase HisJ family protein [Oscillospiraceae bacterium]